MKFSKLWLEEKLHTKFATTLLLSQLTELGFEIDSVSSFPKFSKVVVGKVLSSIQHPNADKLHITEVDVGLDTNLHIVCGAPNCRAGIFVACATIGADLPGNIKIKKSKLRGEVSEGMLCSLEELGIPSSKDGILEFDNTAASYLGTEVYEYLHLEDDLIEISITPNRGDMLSLTGIAREIASLNKISVNLFKELNIPTSFSTDIEINVDVNSAPKFILRQIRNLDNTISTPWWITEKLRRSGIASINAIVDILNYVMLDTGQPLHSYAADKIHSPIEVRTAFSHEKITVLQNSREIILDNDTLVVADKDRVLSIAGICGGEDSKTLPSTREILLEAACFIPTKIINRSRKYDLSTEAAYRFERGVDPAICEYSLDLATQLILDICGGEASEIVSVISTTHTNEFPIKLVWENIPRLIGEDIPRDVTQAILQRLGYSILSANPKYLELLSPSWRYNVHLEEDAIEDVIRVYGYNAISAKQLLAQDTKPSFPSLQETLQEVLLNASFHEIVTYSFLDKTSQAAFSDIPGIVLPSPISTNMSVMRTSLFPGLSRTLDYNFNRQVEQMKVFEVGQCFIQQNGTIHQDTYLGFALGGKLIHKDWYAEAVDKLDFFDLKAVIESISTALGQEIEFNRETFLGLHIGQSALLSLAGKPIGRIGKIHPLTSRALKISPEIYLAEINLSTIERNLILEYKDISKFPTLSRDIAVIVEDTVQVGDILKICNTYKPRENVELYTTVFDVYTGNTIQDGYKSIALSINFTDITQTLDENEISIFIDNLLKLLYDHFKATLREV